jgi:exodeoxyribonuclease VII small subunit
MTERLRGVTLEEAMERLDDIAQQLGGAELELAESLALYEEGIRLLRHCEALMAGAEERIQQLRADGEDFRVEPFDEAP